MKILRHLFLTLITIMAIFTQFNSNAFASRIVGAGIECPHCHSNTTFLENKIQIITHEEPHWATEYVVKCSKCKNSIDVGNEVKHYNFDVTKFVKNALQSQDSKNCSESFPLVHN